MKKRRQAEIARIITARPIATQQELAGELAHRGFTVNQSSISRDIVDMGLIKINGAYSMPPPIAGELMRVQLDTAGDNLVVAKTEIGQAQPVAVTIDRAGISGIVGTVAGDDTILIATKDAASQRAVLGRLVALFAPERAARGRRTRRPVSTARTAARRY